MPRRRQHGRHTPQRGRRVPAMRASRPAAGVGSPPACDGRSRARAADAPRRATRGESRQPGEVTRAGATTESYTSERVTSETRSHRVLQTLSSPRQLASLSAALNRAAAIPHTPAPLSVSLSLPVGSVLTAAIPRMRPRLHHHSLCSRRHSSLSPDTHTHARPQVPPLPLRCAAVDASWRASRLTQERGSHSIAAHSSTQHAISSSAAFGIPHLVRIDGA